MLKKRLSLLLSLVLCFTALLSMPFSAQAATKLTLSGSSTAYVGCTSTLTVKVNNKKVSASKCNFSSSNRSVATVSNSGVVTAAKKGSTTITAKLKSNSKVYAKFKITVKSNTLKTPLKTISFAKGCSNTLVIYNGSKRVYGGDVTFSSSDKTVATVSSGGVVSAKAKGSAVIKVSSKKSKGMYISIKINVRDTKSFVLTPTSTPLNGSFINYSGYNSTTKMYYTIRSYLEYFEKHPGCTLTFRAGQYNVCNVLYIPSNTTIRLLDGATIKKIYDTKSSAISASATLVAFCAPSKAAVSGAYNKYNGVHNSKLIGYGNAKIDMAGQPASKLCCAVVMCHNKSISIEGIAFSNISYGHFIEMDASKDVKVNNCSFSNHSDPNKKSAGECINLDTPDKNTGGFTQTWTSYDCTANYNVSITNCSFNKVQRAIGTHQYSENQYHTNVTIDNCSINECMYGGVYMMNWKNAVITNNTFNGVGKDTKGNVINPDYLQSNRVLFMAGCSTVNISGNSFSNCYQVGAISSHQANGYEPIYNQLTDDELYTMCYTNTCGENVDLACFKAYQNWDGNSAAYRVFNIS